MALNDRQQKFCFRKMEEWPFFQMSALKKPKLQEAEGVYANPNYGQNNLLGWVCLFFSQSSKNLKKKKKRANLTPLGHSKVTCSYLSPSMNFQVAETSFGVWKIKVDKNKKNKKHHVSTVMKTVLSITPPGRNEIFHHVLCLLKYHPSFYNVDVV